MGADSTFGETNFNPKQKMKRYFIYFKGGNFCQQDGINQTYMRMHELGLIPLIIDTKEGQIINGDKWEWVNIPDYHDSDLIVEKDML